MASVLLTYDVSQRHSEVKAALRKKGLMDSWTSDNKTYNLPDTTMWKQGDTVTPSSVKADMDAVVSDLNLSVSSDRKIELERCIAVSFTTWAGKEGKAHKS